MTEDDETPLEDLLKPLSAKVMPKSARYSISGKEISNEEAIRSQRKAAHGDLNRATKHVRRGRYK